MLYTSPNQCIMIKKTIMVSRKLNNSLIISDMGYNIMGMFNDLIKPADDTIFAMDWLVRLEKKNQIINPDVQYKT